MGAIEMDQRNYGSAARWLKDASTREPDNARHHLLLCEARYRLGDEGGARRAIIGRSTRQR